ncbi:hypothetical protein [Microbulbifer litoralis]|uniref:hypothetical protein n=1 Tax=Microbulbifer litoralis TaxID=2933965 RepID=UPI002028631D|nr:hypothetical protein [Microbulbifer sp. GX H0434]
MVEEKALHDVLLGFLHKIESLHETMPLLMAMMYISRRMTRVQKAKFLTEHGEIIEENEEFKRYRLSIENERMVSRLEKKHERANTASDMLPSKFLISYVSEYDAFLGSLIKRILELKPELLNSGDKNISFSLLKELGSVDAAFKHVIEKEVESVLRDSHAEHFKWLEKICNVPLTKGLESWSSFIELTERRNLFVHCDGVISAQYMANCRLHNCSLSEEDKVGVRLTADKVYLDASFECLYEIAVKLTQVLWRKLFPQELDGADSSLINVSFSLIHEGQYSLAQKILDFGTETIKRHASDSNRRILIINRAQSYYHDNNKTKANEILDKEDWSSCADHFQLCVNVLKEDFDAAESLMKRIGDNGQIKEADYLDWPVFREFRKIDSFKSTFEEIFAKPPVNISELVKSVEPEEALDGLKEELEAEFSS